ncbi:MAG: DUF4830 domain-containing protein [Eubacteriales bacterium]|nr:DUF4830 domain-containing protein [Eubacteriales bacterium]
MFIKTVKWNPRKCIAILILMAVVLSVIILLLGKNDASDDPLKGNEERVEYLASCGWEVESEPVDTQQIVLPQELSDVFAEYNELQKKQGFDLSKFAGRQATLYSYRVTNYPSTDTVLANLYVVEGRVIGGDIHSTSLNGFMHTLM